MSANRYHPDNNGPFIVLVKSVAPSQKPLNKKSQQNADSMYLDSEVNAPNIVNNNLHGEITRSLPGLDPISHLVVSMLLRRTFPGGIKDVLPVGVNGGFR